MVGNTYIKRYDLCPSSLCYSGDRIKPCYTSRDNDLQGFRSPRLLITFDQGVSVQPGQAFGGPDQGPAVGMIAVHDFTHLDGRGLEGTVLQGSKLLQGKTALLFHFHFRKGGGGDDLSGQVQGPIQAIGQAAEKQASAIPIRARGQGGSLAFQRLVQGLRVQVARALDLHHLHQAGESRILGGFAGCPSRSGQGKGHDGDCVIDAAIDRHAVGKGKCLECGRGLVRDPRPGDGCVYGFGSARLTRNRPRGFFRAGS